MNKKANNLDSSFIKQNAHSSLIQSINSTELLGKDGVVYIQHNGELYQLRQTKAGKLILTK
ncbi:MULTISPECIES: hemin uptake protein HemP [Gammaproteobacteria]|uniref:hemin uptake protein HemP n=1 Tax=Pseudomonas sp. FME51 TaxID=2742609 RepID=UPI001867769C